MADNFNPGFDREKKAFIDLANRGEGLTPINYLFADEANFESVLASYVTGGMFDVNMLYATAIEATNIITDILNADIAYIDTAYVNTAYIEKITIKKAYVDYLYADHVTIYDDLTVGELNSTAAVDFYSSYYKIVNASIFEILTPTLSIDAPGISIVSQLMNVTAPTPSGLISFNAPFFAINFIESSVLPLGTVSIYSGEKIIMSAPITIIGAPISVGEQPRLLELYSQDVINIDARNTINIISNDVTNIRGITFVSLTSVESMEILSDELITIRAEEGDINIHAINLLSLTSDASTITGTTRLNLTSDANITATAATTTITGTDMLSLSSNLDIKAEAPNTSIIGNQLLTLRSQEDINITSNARITATAPNTSIFGNESLALRSQARITAIAPDISITGATALSLLSDTDINIGGIDGIITERLTARAAATSITGTDLLSLESTTRLTATAQEIAITGNNLLNLDSNGEINVRSSGLVKVGANTTTTIIGTDLLSLNSNAKINITSISGEINLSAELSRINSEQINMTTDLCNLAGSLRILEAKYVSITSDRIYLDGDFTVNAPNTINLSAALYKLDVVNAKWKIGLGAECIIDGDLKVITRNINTDTGAYKLKSITNTIDNAAEMEIKTNMFTVNSGGLIKLEAVKATVSSTTQTNLLGIEEVNITSSEVNVDAGEVKVTSDTSVQIKAVTRISLQSPETLAPIPLEIIGEGELESTDGFPVVGGLEFVLPNVLTCVDGVLKTVDFDVVIVFLGTNKK